MVPNTQTNLPLFSATHSLSICYISTHSSQLVIKCNGPVEENTMFSATCVRQSLEPQLHHAVLLTAFIGSTAGPAFE
jgi:hypothetical protein